MPALSRRAKSFGKRVHAYVRGRQGVPPEICKHFRSLLPPRSLVLDIGCGTGISTATVAGEGAIVIGCDVDRRMVAEAIEQGWPGAAFVRAAAERLPFATASFDGATAFSAFHWFANSSAISELRRVLKPGGAVLIVNKFDEDDAKERFRSLVEDITGRTIPNPKAKYDPLTLLRESGFRTATAYSISYVEKFDEIGAKHFFLSTSIAGQIPSALTVEFERQLDLFLKSLSPKNGPYVQPLPPTPF